MIILVPNILIIFGVFSSVQNTYAIQALGMVSYENNTTKTSAITLIKFTKPNTMSFFDTSKQLLFERNSTSIDNSLIGCINQLDNLETRSSKCFENTVELDISFNELEEFPNQLISNWLENLKILNLSFNSLEHLAEFKLFNNSLETLDLSHNKIRHIDANIFEHLNSLKYLDLHANYLHKIGLFTFDTAYRLVDLDLSKNLLNDQAVRFLMFSSLTQLKTLKLNSNNITRIGFHLFTNLKSLETIDVSSNQIISNMDLSSIFKHNRHLVHIDLSFNRNLFASTRNKKPNLINHEQVSTLNLAGIDLSRSLEFDFVDVFKGLRLLNMSACQLHAFTIPSSLTRLEHLDLSNNFLSEFDFKPIGVSSLRSLNLSRNRLTRITHMFNVSNVEIDLRFNLFRTLEGVRPSNTTNATAKSMATMLFEGNQFECSCDPYAWWTGSSIYLQIGNIPFRIKDFESLRCSTQPRSYELNHQHQQHMGINRTTSLISHTDDVLSQIICQFNSYCSQATCKCCPFTACDCNSMCPSKCDCFRNYNHTTEFIFCQNKNLTKLPEQLENNVQVTHLYLNQNGLTRLHSHTFFPKKRLSLVDLSSNQISFIDEFALIGLVDLVTLRLTDNKLVALLGYEFADLPSLENLYLDNNQLKYIASHTFECLYKLKVLNLLHNPFKPHVEQSISLNSMSLLVLHDQTQTLNANGQLIIPMYTSYSHANASRLNKTLFIFSIVCLGLLMISMGLHLKRHSPIRTMFSKAYWLINEILNNYSWYPCQYKQNRTQVPTSSRRKKHRNKNKKICLVFNKIDETLVTKCILPVLQSQSGVVTLHTILNTKTDESQRRAICRHAKIAKTSKWILFVMSNHKKLLNQFDYRWTWRGVPKSKKTVLIIDNLSENIVQWLLRPKNIIRLNMQKLLFDDIDGI